MNVDVLKGPPDPRDSAIECPSCHGAGAQIERTVRLDSQHQLLFPRNPDVQHQLASNSDGMAAEYRLRTCTTCGLTYAWPMVAGTSRWYEVAYSALGVVPEHRWEFDVVVRQLERDDRVYEIGCGTGMFLRMCRNRGISAQGIDFSQHSIDACVADGLNAAKAGVAIETRPPNVAGASVVVSFHVLEHVERPDDFFRHAFHVGAAGATLWVSVPSSRRVARVRSSVEPMDDPPHHLTKWTDRAIAAAGLRSGWHLQAAIFEPFTWRFALWSVTSQYPPYKTALSRGWVDSKTRDRLLRAVLYPWAMGQLLVDRRRRSMTGFSMLAKFSKL